MFNIFKYTMRSKSFRTEFITAILLTPFAGLRWNYVLETLFEDYTKWRECGFNCCQATTFCAIVFFTFGQKFEMDAYSPYLSPPDYFLFPKLKLQLKGTQFDTIDNIQKSVTKHLKKIPLKNYSSAMQNLKIRAQRCIASDGSYFE